MNMQIELNATERVSKASMNFESRNPATGELLGTYPEHNKAETEVRLQRAWDGWRHWSRTPLHERISFLTRLAELLEKRAEPYGRLITAEMGKPLADSIFEIKKSAWAARYDATVGATARFQRDFNGRQPGDPYKAAAAILHIASLAEPPLRLILGSDAFRAVEKNDVARLESDRKWCDLSLSTDFI
jgi:acyl-CoA reductase-like NAD-dependent aldehyde dehydrogenase